MHLWAIVNDEPEREDKICHCRKRIDNPILVQTIGCDLSFQKFPIFLFHLKAGFHSCEFRRAKHSVRSKAVARMISTWSHNSATSVLSMRGFISFLVL